MRCQRCNGFGEIDGRKQTRYVCSACKRWWSHANREIPGDLLNGGLHFRFSDEPSRYTVARVLCGGDRRKRHADWNQTRIVHPSIIVSCAACMVIKDVWLQHGDGKDMKIRFARTFMKKHNLGRNA